MPCNRDGIVCTPAFSKRIPGVNPNAACSGVESFSSSSSSAASLAMPSHTMTQEENNHTECCANHEQPSEKRQSPLPGNLLSSAESGNTLIQENAPQRTNTTLANRKVRIKRKRSTLEQRSNGENGVQKRRENMSGYKYRLLTTPHLTNDQIALPLSPEESIPPIAHIPQSSQKLKLERESYDIDQLQQQYANDLVREKPTENFPEGMKKMFASRWWRNLYQNVGTTQPNSTIPQNDPSLISHSSLRNRRSSSLIEEVINNDSYTGFLPDERQKREEEDEAISDRIRVRSVQAASSIDVVAVLSKVFGGGVAREPSQYTKKHPLSDFFAASPPLRHVFGRTNIIIQLSPPPSTNCPLSLSHSVPRYVAIYRFGSVVFFNLTTKEASRLLDQIKKHAVDPIAVGFERREHFEVALQPRLETATGKISADRAMVRELDMNTVGIVSNIMGQTVALDWHNDTVDELLANFSSVNSSVERTGSFTSMERHTLFQVVARNNSLSIDMVGKLGIKERSDTAWHLSQYEGLHEGMRKEFDLDERFRNVESKLDLIQQNAKFFLEVLQAQKSNTLEWVIIVLISFECVLMIMDMSGWGTKMFSGWSFF